MLAYNIHIFSEHFIHNNSIIKVELSEGKISIYDRFGMGLIVIDHQTNFKTEEDQHKNLTGISIYGEKVVHLGHSNPTVLDQWALLLSQHMHRICFHKDYTIINKIGKGISSSVYRAKSPLNDTPYAVKVFFRKPMRQRQQLALQNEIKILRLLNNDYFPKLLSTYISQQKYYLIMEFAEGMNLREIAKRYSMDWFEKKRVFVEIAKALKLLHSMNIVHRDIKPENIVYNPKNRSIKLLDFGFAVCLSQKSVLYSNCGTPGYAAPELYTKNHIPSPSSDVFSLGIFGYFLFFNEIPYKTPEKLLLDNRDCNFRFTKQLQKSPSLKNLFKRMICQQSLRITLDEFFDHPFIKNKNQPHANAQAIFWHKKAQQKPKTHHQTKYQHKLRRKAISMAIRSHSKPKYDSPLALHNKRLVTDRC